MIRHLSKQDEQGFSTNDWIDSVDFPTSFYSAMTVASYVSQTLRLICIVKPLLLVPWLLAVTTSLSRVFVTTSCLMVNVTACHLTAHETTCRLTVHETTCRLTAIETTHRMTVFVTMGPLTMYDCVCCHAPCQAYKLLNVHNFLHPLTHRASDCFLPSGYRSSSTGHCQGLPKFPDSSQTQTLPSDPLA